MRRRLRPLLLALLLVLAACGAPAAAQPTAAPVSTPAPTAAPTPQQPTATPAPTGGTTARRPSLGEVFTIGVGETVFVDLPDLPGAPALQLRLDGVSDDSRCPRQVACVWAGDATLTVAAEIAGRPAEIIELHTSPQPEGLALAYGAYAIAVADLQPLAERPEDRIEQADYRARLLVTEESAGQGPPATATPAAQGGRRLTVDACSLADPESLADWFGPLQGEPAPADAATRGGQQCAIEAERASLTIAIYAGGDADARAIADELRQAGTPLEEAEDSSLGVEAFGQSDEGAAMVRQFSDVIIVAAATFGAQAQAADRDRAHERLGNLVSIAITRYAAGQTTER